MPRGQCRKARVVRDVFQRQTSADPSTSPSAYDPSAYDHSAYDPSAYDHSAYDTSAYDPSAYDTSAYYTSAYDPSAYDTSAYDYSAYDTSAYDTSAYNTSAYDPSYDTSASTEINAPRSGPRYVPASTRVYTHAHVNACVCVSMDCSLCIYRGGSSWVHRHICAIWPSVQYGHTCNTALCAIWPPVQYGHRRGSLVRISSRLSTHTAMHMPPRMFTCTRPIMAILREVLARSP